MTRSELFRRHEALAELEAREVFLPGATRDDVRQEALIGLWEATGVYDPEQGPFRPFAKVVIRRRLLDAVESANRFKHRFLTDAKRTAVDPDGVVREIVDQLAAHELGPDELVLLLEELRGLVGAILGLSELERRAIVRVIDGLGPETKQDDNALQRARTKLRRVAA